MWTSPDLDPEKSSDTSQPLFALCLPPDIPSCTGGLEPACPGSRAQVISVSSHLRVQGPQLDALKSATVGVFTPWKWATTTNQGFPLLSGIHC